MVRLQCEGKFLLLGFCRHLLGRIAIGRVKFSRGELEVEVAHALLEPAHVDHAVDVDGRLAYFARLGGGGEVRMVNARVLFPNNEPGGRLDDPICACVRVQALEQKYVRASLRSAPPRRRKV